jgi:predicted metalloprotease with PDZ domain
MIISPEKVSLAADGPPGMLGDYSASTHLQGELLGSMLDLVIRDVTNNARSIDDVMRIMMNRFSGTHGFDRKDIEKVVSEVCQCNMHSFFENNIRGNKPIDFDKYLLLAGLKSEIVWTAVMGNDSTLVPDLRVYAWQAPNENVIRLGITNPLSCWGKSGLHTGDIIKTVNGQVLINAAEFRQKIRNSKFGDTMEIEVLQKTGLLKTKIHITGFQQPVVRISPLTAISKRQQKVYSLWVLGK